MGKKNFLKKKYKKKIKKKYEKFKKRHMTLHDVI